MKRTLKRSANFSQRDANPKLFFYYIAVKGTDALDQPEIDSESGASLPGDLPISPNYDAGGAFNNFRRTLSIR